MYRLEMFGGLYLFASTLFARHGRGTFLLVRGTAWRLSLISWVMVMLFLALLPGDALAERVYLAGYKSGFYIRSEEEGGMDLRLGGSFWVDYRAYAESQRADNRFDIRRARLIFNGQLTRWFRYALEYEFQGNITNHILDAYGEFTPTEVQAVRVGQFKEPFSLEWQSADKAQWFAERSMGIFLTPGRDIGLMYYGSLYQDSVNYGIGLFNGDGIDGSTRGSYHDSPEIAGRIAVKPFGTANTGALRNLQVGASASYAAIDTANIDLKVKSAGMIGLPLNVYVLSHNTKFGVLQDVDTRTRGGLEAAWINQSFALTGEYLRLKYSDLETAERAKTDADFSSWYVSMAYCLTGEDFSLAGGVINPISPVRFFNPEEKTYGALVLAARYEHFTGDKDWITQGANVSVGDADAMSACATWILFPMLRIIADYTYTELSDPIRTRVNTDGSIDYIVHENVITLRLSMDL
jgi:phosphate-selective porin OprO/OprP